MEWRYVVANEQINEMSYVSFTALSQVIGEVVMDVGAEPAAILWVQLEDLPQGPHTDVLQVTVSQRLHICICLDHLAVVRKVSPNKIPFACRGVQLKQRSYNKLCNSLKRKEMFPI